MNTSSRQNNNDIVSPHRLRLRAYIRMSTDRQELSPATQEYHMRQTCERHNVELVQVMIDPGVSAYKTKLVDRPEGLKLLNDIASKKRDFDGIIIYNFDRVFRGELREQIEFLDYITIYNCQLWTIEGPVDYQSPYGEALIGIRGIFARLESRNTSKRIKDALQAQVSSGKWVSSHAPLGLSYDKESKQVIVTNRAPDVVKIFEEYIKNSGNAAKTAVNLNLQNILTAKNNLWSNQALIRIVKNPMYRQKIPLNNMLVYAPQTLPRIVPQELTDQVDILIQKYGKISSRSKGSPHPYSGLITCALCGSNVRANSSSPDRIYKRIGINQGKPVRYYGWSCTMHDKGMCDSRSISNRFVDKLVGQAVSKLFHIYKKEISKSKSKSNTSSNKPKKSAIQNIEIKRRRLMEQRERWVIAFTKLLVDEKTMEKQIALIDEEIKKLEAPPEIISITSEVIEQWIDKVEDNWEELPPADKKELLVLLGAKITLHTRKNETVWVELETDIHSDSVKVELTGHHKHRHKDGN
jgi:DNA invertase Pin-like site-specific DNA recombinase